MPETLANVAVLVTRPALQAKGLVDLIEAEGGQALQFPMIEIVPPTDPSQLDQALGCLEQYDLAIFVSRNAVEHAVLPILQRFGTWPAGVEVAAVGAQTAQYLGRFKVAVQWQPDSESGSEAFLRTLKSRGLEPRQVVIFRGDGGRELIADTLRRNGAQVDYVECYRRRIPEMDRSALIRLLVEGDISLILVTSEASLRNLYEVIGDREAGLIRSTPVLVLSDRLAKKCEDLGHRNIAIAKESSDLGIVERIKSWHRHLDNYSGDLDPK